MINQNQPIFIAKYVFYFFALSNFTALIFSNRETFFVVGFSYWLLFFLNFAFAFIAGLAFSGDVKRGPDIFESISFAMWALIYVEIPIVLYQTLAYRLDLKEMRHVYDDIILWSGFTLLAYLIYALIFRLGGQVYLKSRPMDSNEAIQK